jgi:organic hydroperoxide reductase OsmC/OhrA
VGPESPAQQRRNICSRPVTRRVSAARSISSASSTRRTPAKLRSNARIGPREGGGFGLAVKLHVEDKSLPQAELAALAEEAHEKICPYSHATRGNVDVTREVVGG